MPIIISGVREAPPTFADIFFSYLPLSLLPILARLRNQSIPAKDRIYLLAGTGVELSKNTDMLGAVAAVDTVSVTDFVVCHVHLSTPLLTKKSASLRFLLNPRFRYKIFSSCIAYFKRYIVWSFASKSPSTGCISSRSRH